MSDFVLTCESAADRTREFFASRNIPVVCFHYEIDDVVYTDDLYQSITPDEFFAQIAAGAMPKTSQVSVGEYEEFWEPFVAEGKDVLHLTLSSGISGTYGSACVAAQMLADRYPQGGKVRVIDSLAASSGFASDLLNSYIAVLCMLHCFCSVKHIAVAECFTHAYRSGMFEYLMQHCITLLWSAKTGQQNCRTIFLHTNWCREYIQSTRFKQSFQS